MTPKAIKEGFALLLETACRDFEALLRMQRGETTISAPLARQRRELLKSSGQTKEGRTSHGFLQDAGPQPPTVPLSFRIGLWPIGSRRLVDDPEHSPCVDERCAGAHVIDLKAWLGWLRALGVACAYQHITPDRDRRLSPQNQGRIAVFKSALTFFAIVAGAAKRLPLFRPASISRELEQTLSLVRCRQERREKAAARRLSSAV
jgi:hypothetical protein